MIDTGRIKDRSRGLSKALLGTQFRAEVGAFIAIGEAPFWARAMAEQLGLPENKVSAELSRFVANNLLTSLSVAAWDRRHLYEQAPGSGSFWAAALDIVRMAAEEEAMRVGVDPQVALEAYVKAVHGDGVSITPKA